MGAGGGGGGGIEAQACKSPLTSQVVQTASYVAGNIGNNHTRCFTVGTPDKPKAQRLLALADPQRSDILITKAEYGYATYHFVCAPLRHTCLTGPEEAIYCVLPLVQRSEREEVAPSSSALILLPPSPAWTPTFLFLCITHILSLRSWVPSAPIAMSMKEGEEGGAEAEASAGAGQGCAWLGTWQGVGPCLRGWSGAAALNHQHSAHSSPRSAIAVIRLGLPTEHTNGGSPTPCRGLASP